MNRANFEIRKNNEQKKRKKNEKVLKRFKIIHKGEKKTKENSHNGLVECIKKENLNVYPF